MDYSNLNTERFTLKVLRPEMVGAEYLSWFSSSETTEYIDYAKNKVTLSGLKSYVQEKLENEKILFFGIFLKDSLLHIGNIKFEPIDFEKGFAILGVLIGDNNWRGVGVFAEISKVLEKSLSEKNIKKIYLGVDKSNSAAVKAYLKEGYRIDESNLLGADLKLAVSMVKEI